MKWTDQPHPPIYPQTLFLEYNKMFCHLSVCFTFVLSLWTVNFWSLTWVFYTGLRHVRITNWLKKWHLTVCSFHWFLEWFFITSYKFWLSIFLLQKYDIRPLNVCARHLKNNLFRINISFLLSTSYLNK